MYVPKLLTIISALTGLLIIGVAGYFVLRPPGALLAEAQLTSAEISPNADGVRDLTTIEYSLRRSAQVSIYLQPQAGGEPFYFRRDEPRDAGDYRVLFSGVVDGYRGADDTDISGTIERRLLPAGTYTWVIEALNDDENEQQSGTLTITDVDSALPVISTFTIYPQRFTPNQDGVNDRVSVNICLAKEADLDVYLEDDAGERYYLPERLTDYDPYDKGVCHEYDYDGGVDQNMEPPPDGYYTVYAVAQDDEGQRIVRTGDLTINNGGLPQVEMVPQATGAEVYFAEVPYDADYYSSYNSPGQKLEKPPGVKSDLSTVTITQDNVLLFKLTVSNYGSTPVRTAGPFPGTVYDFHQMASTLGAYEQSGAWRIGIKCETALSDFPWRWAIAPEKDLKREYDKPAGQITQRQIAAPLNRLLNTELNAEAVKTYYYLLPGQRAEVWGGIRMTELIRARNPQYCWAGLIHEDVGIPASQSRYGAREIEIVPAPPAVD
jgi:hypothetical protein